MPLERFPVQNQASQEIFVQSQPGRHQVDDAALIQKKQVPSQVGRTQQKQPCYTGFTGVIDAGVRESWRLVPMFQKTPLSQSVWFRLDSLKRGPKRPRHELRSWSTSYISNPGCWRGQGHGTHTKKSLSTQWRWPKRQALCGVRGRTALETRGCPSPLETRWFHHEPCGSVGLMFYLLDFSLVLVQHFLATFPFFFFGMRIFFFSFLCDRIM